MTSTPSASAIAIERARRLRRCCSVSTIPVLSGLLSIPSDTPSPRPSRRPAAEQAANSTLDQQHGEEREEIKDRKIMAMHGRLVSARTGDAQPPSKRHH